jgi:DinB superfamily
MQETTAPEAMEQEKAAMLAELRDAPEAFALLFAREDEETLHHRPAPGEWSAVEIVAHLGDLDAFNRTERFNAILMEDHPTLPVYEPDARVATANYQALSGTEALDFLKRERDLIVSLLEGLRPHELARTGMHPRDGERSLMQLADMRKHDRTHLDQVSAAIAAAKGETRS